MSDFLNPRAEIQCHGRDLPHWQQNGVMQFITFRLADSLPQCLLDQWQYEISKWIELHPKPHNEQEKKEYRKRFTVKIEHWLDQGSGQCIFTNENNRNILAEVLMHSQGERYQHIIWVIMPNHVHLLCSAAEPISELVKIWKGVSARRINQGSIWQTNFRDTAIRNPEHFAAVVRYIRKNPIKLLPTQYSLWQSPQALQIPDMKA